MGKSDDHKENFDFWKIPILQVHKVTEESDTHNWKWRVVKLQSHKVTGKSDDHKENFDFWKL